MADLSTNTVFDNLDKYVAIIINHYRLNPQLYNSLISHIDVNGILWINGFREIPSDNTDITESDILLEEDFNSLNRYKLEDKKLYELYQRKFVRYIWRR